MPTPPDAHSERRFAWLLANSLATQTIGAFVWWVYIFWAFIETRSVIVTGVVGAVYMILVAVVSPAYGTLVDRRGARHAMVWSSWLGTALLAVAGLLYVVLPTDDLLELGRPWFWLFTAVLLSGSVATAMRGLAIATTVSVLVREDRRDRANGLIGTTNGVSFMVTSLFSGAGIGYLGVGWSFVITVVVLTLATLHLVSLPFDDRTPAEVAAATATAPEPQATPEPEAASERKVDLRGGIEAIREVPGLWFLIALSAFNNLLGGVFMALLDAYGLTIVSAQVWGFSWAVISSGMILGGLYVAKVGLGPWPIRALIWSNLVGWIACSLFSLRSSIWWVAVGIGIWLVMSPITEAAEQTILQRAIPHERQGRVFGIAQLAENATAPITSIAIAPIADAFFIPTMTDGWGAERIGSWFGTGPERGMAVLFVLAGLLGVLVTLVVRFSGAYRRFASSEPPAPNAPDAPPAGGTPTATATP